MEALEKRVADLEEQVKQLLRRGRRRAPSPFPPHRLRLDCLPTDVLFGCVLLSFADVGSMFHFSQTCRSNQRRMTSHLSKLRAAVISHGASVCDDARMCDFLLKGAFDLVRIDMPCSEKTRRVISQSSLTLKHLTLRGTEHYESSWSGLTPLRLESAIFIRPGLPAWQLPPFQSVVSFPNAKLLCTPCAGYIWLTREWHINASAFPRLVDLDCAFVLPAGRFSLDEATYIARHIGTFLCLQRVTFRVVADWYHFETQASALETELNAACLEIVKRPVAIRMLKHDMVSS